MKYLVLLGDGMADLPLPDYDNKTPLEIASTPQIDLLAKKGVVGLAKTVPGALPPGSDVANLAVMGYNPDEYYTGRSPLEAASIGVDLKPDDYTFRCNLVTLSDEENYEDRTMIDYSAGEISTAEAAEIIKTIGEKLGTEIMEFHRGISYRHLLVWHGAKEDFNLTPPHDISDKKITEYLPNVPVLLDLMKKSAEILKDHPVNLDRIKRGLNPATSIWLWGAGTKPALSPFKEKYGLNASVLSAVDLVKGIGKCADMNVVEVPNVTGTIDTDFEGKTNAAINELKNGADFVYLHFEAPDECGHHGDTEGKIKSIEYLNSRVLTHILDAFADMGEDYTILIMPDHPTPIALKTHTRTEVPFLLYRSNNEKDHPCCTYDEKCAKKCGVYIEEGHKLLSMIINNEI
ncbi:MAG: cofactor-independent phosphoglycerate mutase [Clostridia bacterium]|nr:cofactor-independent phosphoglycerate mutase [Clostridia bacterium]